MSSVDCEGEYKRVDQLLGSEGNDDQQLSEASDFDPLVDGEELLVNASEDSTLISATKAKPVLVYLSDGRFDRSVHANTCAIVPTIVPTVVSRLVPTVFSRVVPTKVPTEALWFGEVMRKIAFVHVPIQTPTTNPIVGDIIKASDVMTTSEEMIGKTYEVAVYARKQFVMDVDILLPGVNLVIIAPAWSIDSNKVIDLSGREGFQDAKPVTPRTPDDFLAHPAPGSDGKAGHPGESSGNLMIAGLTDEDASKLTINLNGGDGGKGQDAGDGATAADIRPPKMITDSSGGVWGADVGTHIGDNVVEHFKYLWTTYAKPGGDSGRPGPGGLPGEAGVLLARANITNVNASKGRVGSIGNLGNPGKGAIGYNKHTWVVKREPHGSPSGGLQFTEYSRDVEAVKSADGKQLNETSSDTPVSAVPSSAIRSWEHTLAFLKEQRNSQSEAKLTTGTTKTDDTQASPTNVDVEALRRTYVFLGLPSFDVIRTIMLQLTIEELSRLDKEVGLVLWQGLEDGVRDFVQSRTDMRSRTKANIIFGAIRHKIAYTKQPTLELTSLSSSPEGGDYPYVWNLSSFIQLLDSHLASLKEQNKQVLLSKQKNAYGRCIDEKIEESKGCAGRLKVYLDQAIAAIDVEVGKIINKIKDLISKTKKDIEKIKKQIERLKVLRCFKIVFSFIQLALSVASIVFPAIAPIALLVTTAMNAATSITEDWIKTEDAKKLNVKFPDLNFKDRFQPDESLTKDKSRLKELREAKTQEEFDLAKSKYAVQAAFEGKETNTIAFVESEDLMKLSFESRTKEIAALESKVANGEKALEANAQQWNKRAAVATTVLNEGVNIYNTWRSADEDVSEAEKNLKQLEEELKKLETVLTNMDDARKAFDNMAKDLDVAIGTYCNKSFSELIATSAEFLNRFNGLSSTFVKVQKALEIDSTIGEHIETVKVMYGGIVDIYKQIAQYKDHKEFAGYIADLHIGDGDEDINDINALLEGNYLLTQHCGIMRTLKVHLAIGHGVAAVDGDDPLDPNKFVNYMKENKNFVQDTYTPFFEQVISGIKSIILRDGAYITDKDSMINCNVKYESEALTHATAPSNLKTLMEGGSISISLSPDNCALNLFAATKVNLRIEHAEAKLNGPLQGYLSSNLEAVLIRTGCSKFKVGDKVYKTSFSCPPPLKHYMNGNSGNKAMKKLEEVSASPTLSPFGGLWDVKLKVVNHPEEIVNLLDPITLAAIFEDASLKPLDFLMGLKVYLYFEGQSFDFHLNEKSKRKLPQMETILDSI